jgi:hypothetical protein
MLARCEVEAVHDDSRVAVLRAAFVLLEVRVQGRLLSLARPWTVGAHVDYIGCLRTQMHIHAHYNILNLNGFIKVAI